jgi:hypothetical protein
LPWVRIDEEFPDHPKVVGAGPLGIAMQVAALCYCNRHLTDGFVPRSAARRLIDLDGLGVSADDVISTMLGVGMWSRVDGGYQIHDYDIYQPTRAQVLAERERNRAAGQKGGLAKGAKRSAKRSASEPLSEVPSTVLAEGLAVGNGHPGSQPESASEVLSDPLANRLAEPLAKSKPVPVPETVTQAPPPSLPLQVDASEGCKNDNQRNRTEGKGKAHSPGRPPRVPRHPTDDFVVQRARQIQAEDGPEAARAYLRKVGENYGQADRDDQLRRLEEAMTPEERAQLRGGP